MNKDVVRITSGVRSRFTDTVTDESFLTLYLNDAELLTLLCSPDNLKELAAGFLFSASLIRSVDDIEHISIDTAKMTARVSTKEKNLTEDVMFKRIYTSGCGKNMLFYNSLDIADSRITKNTATVSHDRITNLVKQFEAKSVSYKTTGGVHSAALCAADGIIVFREDIGRHNAIDKVIGAALFKGLNMAYMLLLTSGRISSEVMYKVQKMGCAIIVSRSAPTSLAVKLAEKWHVTLIGFVRGKRMNLYSGEKSIV